MENILVVSASPHITKKSKSTQAIMRDVLIALFPCLVAAVLFYGYHVLINLIVCLIFCGGSEYLFGLITHKKKKILESTLTDLSFAVTALILALNLPSVMTVSSWGLNFTMNNGMIAFSFDTVIICALGSIFAIIIAKMLFGGLGKNFANPADCARVFLFIAFSASGAFTAVSTATGLDAATGATWLSGKGAVSGSLILDMFLGKVSSAAAGESCVIAILLGYAYLCIRKVIDYRIPLMTVGFFAVSIFLFDCVSLQGSAIGKNLVAHVFSGGLLFGSVFMATDYSTSPNTFKGNIIYCAGLGVLTALIRAFGIFPEGFSFALLVMNIAVPLIDKYIIPKPFGYVKPPRKIKANVSETGAAARVARVADSAFGGKSSANTMPETGAAALAADSTNGGKSSANIMPETGATALAADSTNGGKSSTDTIPKPNNKPSDSRLSGLQGESVKNEWQIGKNSITGEAGLKHLRKKKEEDEKR